MKDYVSLGTSPYDEENCVQLGSENYTQRAREECNRFINLLREIHGNEPEGARLGIKNCPHDFGTYLDVVCYFDNDNEKAQTYAYNLEDNVPARWK